MEAMNMPVTLIVKAPNQQIEDQTVRCELNWTIKKLKGYLSEVYPSKPRTEDQKLIYSGQLLHDTVILKDILRCYEGQEKHTVHLVCSSSRDFSKVTHSHSANMISENQQPQQNTGSRSDHITTTGDDSPQSSSVLNSNDGLRHRVTTDSHPTWGDPQMMWGMYENQRTPWSANNLYNPADFAQQMAWMQEAYAQYMAQYMQLMASGSVTSSLTTSLQVPPSTSPAVTPAPQPAPQPERDEPVGANDVVQNVAGGEEEEARANRDWLDWFYFVSRSLVLFSIVYFYSSPVRFFFVSTLGIIMYLYQVGFFRAAGGQAVAAAEPQAPPAGAGPAPAPPVENNNTSPDTSSSAEASPAPPQADRPSLLTLTWSIFSSFFLSLIPEQPNVI